MADNVTAFLDMLAECEGTGDAYNALFGYTPKNGKVFDNGYATHPNIKYPFVDKNGKLDYSTAAGRYQIIHPTFVRLQDKLGTTDFSPETQDRMAMELISERGAMSAVKEGRLQDAIDRCSPEWASLPSSTYPQPKRSVMFAEDAFVDAGGTIA